MTGLLHDLRARIVVLVDAVAEAHEAEAVVLVLGPADIFRDTLGLADLTQHIERRLVGAAVGRSPEAGTSRSDTGKGIGAGGAGEPHGRGRRVLLVVSMQNKDAVHRAGEN